MDEMNFTAVDFETADRNHEICEVGIVVVRNGVIVDKFQSLVQPPFNKYSEYNIGVHGITPDMTKDKPTFEELWPQIKHYFVDTTVVAHQKSTDENALRKNLRIYNLPEDGINEFLCTCTYYKKTGLEALCYGFDMPYDPDRHHSALFDAECCAVFAIHMLKGEDPDWNKVAIKKAEIDARENKRKRSAKPAKKQQSVFQEFNFADINPGRISPFKDRRVLITGVFNIDRNRLRSLFLRWGATLDSNVTKKTHFVIRGEKPGPEKMQRLDKLIHDGFNIRVLEQYDLDRILSGDWDSYYLDKEIVKDLDFTVEHFEKHHLSFKNDYNIIASKELFVGGDFSGKVNYFNTITGNLGAFDSPYLCQETQICVLSDKTISKLYKGEKDETIKLIQDYYNNNKSIVFEFSFLTESDILDFCKRRCEKCGDELTMSYYEMYMESAMKALENASENYVFKEGKNYTKSDGKYVLKLEGGRTWCPSRQFRGDTYTIKEEKSEKKE